MTFGSLFAGIGGLDLGLERADMRCLWQVEIDDYCRKVLAKHWPNVPRWDDVTTFTGEGFERPDLICGGFPCQDISNAGKCAGIEGERSGLWAEFSRIIRVFRPRYVLVENVAALLGRGLGPVLGDLAASGYDAEWDCIPACAVGAHQERDRLFIVANTHGQHGRARRPRRLTCDSSRDAKQKNGKQVSDANGSGLTDHQGQCAASESPGRYFVGAENIGRGLRDYWRDKSDVRRVVHGVPNRVDRIRGLGNAVVPQVAEWIGRRIMEAVN